MPRCDSSQTYTRAVWPEPSPADLRRFPAGVSEVSRFSCMKFLGVSGVFDYAGLSRSSRYRACSCCLPRITRTSASGLHLFGAEYPPRLSSVYASLCTSRYPAQDSRPSGSLLLSRKELSSSASSRLSGEAMALIGLRMMPTFPSPPLKFRTASLPRYGFKAGLSDEAFPVGWFAVVLRALPAVTVVPCSESGTMCWCAPPCERSFPLYPRGPRSGPGYAVPVHHHLIGPIRPTRGHIPTSPTSGLYEMPSLCLFV